MTRSTTERGLGWRHRQQVAALLAGHVDGTPCWWCGKPMFRQAERNPDRKNLSGDHSVPRAKGGTETDRLLHNLCNIARRDGSRDEFRPAVTGGSDKPVLPASGLGRQLMPWPWKGAGGADHVVV